MNFNYMDTFVNEDVNHDFDNSRCTARGLGAYEGKAYSAKVTALYRFDGVEMRSVEDKGNKRFEVLIDNEVFTRCPTMKSALVYFLDFTGLTKSKLNKAICPAT